MRYIQGMPVNGIVLRTVGAEDAAQMAALMRRGYAQTPFMNSTEDEFRVTDAEEAAFLKGMEDSERNCMIGAWLDGALVGNVSVCAVDGRRRLRHRATLGIAVVQEAWGRGVGSLLLDAALQTAASAGFRQMELEVAADNARAIALYERFGFETYGRRPEALRREDGAFVDELLMFRRLGRG